MLGEIKPRLTLIVGAVVNKDYPQRIFDSGLSVIPVVLVGGGNTSL